jgi:hypothetical protein
MAMNYRILNEVGVNGLKDNPKPINCLNMQERKELDKLINEVKYEKKL